MGSRKSQSELLCGRCYARLGCEVVSLISERYSLYFDFFFFSFLFFLFFFLFFFFSLSFFYCIFFIYYIIFYILYYLFSIFLFFSFRIQFSLLFSFINEEILILYGRTFQASRFVEIFIWRRKST